MILGKVFPVFITLLCLTACAEQDLELKHHCEMVQIALWEEV